MITQHRPARIGGAKQPGLLRVDCDYYCCLYNTRSTWYTEGDLTPSGLPDPPDDIQTTMQGIVQDTRSMTAARPYCVRIDCSGRRNQHPLYVTRILWYEKYRITWLL